MVNIETLYAHIQELVKQDVDNILLDMIEYANPSPTEFEVTIHFIKQNDNIAFENGGYYASALLEDVDSDVGFSEDTNSEGIVTFNNVPSGYYQVIFQGTDGSSGDYELNTDYITVDSTHTSFDIQVDYS